MRVALSSEGVGLLILFDLDCVWLALWFSLLEGLVRLERLDREFALSLCCCSVLRLRAVI